MLKRYLLLLLFFHSILNLNAQQITISGTVVAVDDGSALPGVSIVVKGSTLGTITDLDGKYFITVSSSKDSLQFSYLGMLTQLIAINNQLVINVKMVADQKNMNEVVVTALGIKREKKALGYSVQEIKGMEMQTARDASFINQLSGCG